MKKFIPLLVLVPYLFIAGKKDTRRFKTPEQMVNALLTCLQNNDTLRYMELYPTKEEALIAFGNIPDPLTGELPNKENISAYYANRVKSAITIFENARKRVIDHGINWTDVTTDSMKVNMYKGNNYSSDSLCEIYVRLKTADRIMFMKLEEVMLTASGWNCGLNIKIKVQPTPKETARANAERDSLYKADSLKQIEMMAQMNAEATRMVDSLNAAFAAEMAKRLADSAHMADSIAKAVESAKKAKKNPR